jgi:hypothetical protein
MKIFFSLIFSLGIATAAQAQTKSAPAKKAVNQAVLNQVKSGKLTPKQAADIKARAAAVKGNPANINKVLTPEEKAKLTAALAKQKTNTAKK